MSNPQGAEITTGAPANASTFNTEFDKIGNNIGDTDDLGTTTKSSVVAAIGTESLDTSVRATIVGAINSLHDEHDELNNEITAARGGQASIDARIDLIQAEVDAAENAVAALSITASGITSTTVNGNQSASTTLNVASGASFVNGGYVTYENAAGNLEYRQIASGGGTNALVLTASHGGVSTGDPVTSITTSEYLARALFHHGVKLHHPMAEGATGDGSTNDSAVLSTLWSTTMAGGGTCIIDRAYAITSAITVPADVTLLFTRGGKFVFDTNSALRLTVNGTIEAGAYQIFDVPDYGAGLHGQNGVPVNAQTSRNWFSCPEWYGAVGDGVTPDDEALKKVQPGHIRIFLPNRYLLTETLAMATFRHWVGIRPRQTQFELDESIAAFTVRDVYWIDNNNFPVSSATYSAYGGSKETVSSAIICNNQQKRYTSWQDVGIRITNLNKPTAYLIFFDLHEGCSIVNTDIEFNTATTPIVRTALRVAHGPWSIDTMRIGGNGVCTEEMCFLSGVSGSIAKNINASMQTAEGIILSDKVEWVGGFIEQAAKSATISGITPGGATVTVHTVGDPHYLTTGDIVQIVSTPNGDYTGEYTVTVTDSDTFTYSSAVVGTDAAGTVYPQKPALTIQEPKGTTVRNVPIATTKNYGYGILVDTTAGANIMNNASWRIENVTMVRASSASAGDWTTPLAFKASNGVVTQWRDTYLSTKAGLTPPAPTLQWHIGEWTPRVLSLDNEGRINSGLSAELSDYVGTVSASGTFQIKMPLGHLGLDEGTVGVRTYAFMIMISGKANAKAVGQKSCGALLFVDALCQSSSEFDFNTNFVVNSGSVWTVAHNTTDNAIELTNSTASSVTSVAYRVVSLTTAHLWREYS